jgi:hypothetical protein
MLPALQRCKYATKFNRSIMETNSLGTMTRLLWAWFLNGVSFNMTHLLRWNVMTITSPWATMVHARINQNRSHWKTLNSHSKQNYRNCFFSQKVDIVIETQIFFSMSMREPQIQPGCKFERGSSICPCDEHIR